ncbi:cardiolipin synthetase [Klebsiella pneumoniae subsp. ozaenae]|uniref:Cardiolipin synthetase n=1 Tax=Klebsiella pneumoniae subsp. ozaenae TaxID=574 RepID=A0A378BAR6_KLEPO|nr:cardiolipin synthetase [Klebsiella pneumoniae subsp. ozaenae]
MHTKSVLVDGELSLVGTVNLDMRSLWLNFEITLVIDDAGFGSDLAAVQDDYISRSRLLECPSLVKTSAVAADCRATVLLLQPVAVKRAHQIPNE